MVVGIVDVTEPKPMLRAGTARLAAHRRAVRLPSNDPLGTVGGPTVVTTHTLGLLKVEGLRVGKVAALAGPVVDHLPSIHRSGDK
jgi:hypothetical protein